MLMCTLFDWEGSEKVYVLYIHLHVDNHGCPVAKFIVLLVVTTLDYIVLMHAPGI